MSLLGKLRDLVYGFAKWVDKQVRYLDMRLNRADENGWWQKRVPITPRHAPIVIPTAFVTLLAMTSGPLLFEGRGFATILVVLVALLVLLLLIRWAKGRGAQPLMTGGEGTVWPIIVLAPWLIWGVLALIDAFGGAPLSLGAGVMLLGVGVVLVLIGAAATPRGGPAIFGWLTCAAAAGAVWFILAEPGTREADGGAPYQHALAPVGVAALFFALPFSRWWSWTLFRSSREKYREGFQKLLDDTQLLDPRIPSRPNRWGLVYAGVLALVRTPFQLLLIPSFAIVCAPTPSVSDFAWTGLAISWIFMTLVVFEPRLDTLLSVFNRAFVEGSSLFVSAFVVAFAAARLAKVGYVTTVLDGAAAGTLLSFLLIFYALSWVYDYWSSRALSAVLLGLLDPKDDAPFRVRYSPPTKKSGGGGKVEEERPCWIQPHGGTRLLVMRDMGAEEDPHWNVYRPLTVFREIATRSETMSAARRRLPRLRVQVQFYRVLPAVLLLGVVAWFGGQLMGTTRTEHVEAELKPATSEGAFSLKAAVTALRGDRGEQAPVYAIAASGGGTRAAIHTMTVLKALADRDLLQRVVLVSSVSGGSLANAYFAHRRPDLLADDNTLRADAWAAFRRAVTGAHIRRVLDGAFEWRLVEGRRWGWLLKESFDDCLNGKRLDLGSCNDVGLIFNTAVTGESPKRDTVTSDTYGESAGTRLVFTNIPQFDAQSTKKQPSGYGPGLRYVCFQDPGVPLASAASASANFPPVFSNLPIDATTGEEFERRYWVTDGGAVENRGLISLLLALKALVHTWSSADGPLPPIRILVADASACGAGFSQDRGLSAVTSSGLKLANRLIAALYEQLEAAYALKSKEAGGGQLEICDLTLPKAIRSGVGTHWMMPTKVTLAPRKWLVGDGREFGNDPDFDLDAEIDLDAAEIMKCFDQLFAPDTRQWPHPILEKWIKNDDPRTALEGLLGGK